MLLMSTTKGREREVCKEREQKVLALHFRTGTEKTKNFYEKKRK